jgi:ATP-dependent Clp protease ATP-binding subunit ClpC
VTDEPSSFKAVLESVKRLARVVETRHGNDATPAMLDEDEDFQAAVAALADKAVPLKVLTLLGRHSSRFVASAATAAIARRGEAPKGWRDVALARMRRASDLEIHFLLDALDSVHPKPLMARVLGGFEEGDASEPIVAMVAAFVARRLADGEQLSEEALRRFADPSSEALIDRVLAELGEEDRGQLAPAVEGWRTQLVDWGFLDTFARRFDPQARPSASLAGDRASALDAIAAAVTERRSVLVVGDAGVGKTSVVEEAMRRLHADGWRAFQATASDINAGQSYVGQLEGRIQSIARAMTRRRLAWLMPGVEDALWAGTYRENPRGMLDALLPYLLAGEVVLIGEIEPLALDQLLQLRPRLAAAFEVVRLGVPAPADAVAIARDWATQAEVEVSDHVLLEARDLAAHFLAATSAPGGLLRLLKHAAGKEAARVGSRDLLVALTESTGLPMAVLDPDATLDLGELRGYFTRRVLGQREAVDCLVERIALVKAGLTDPTRPLGVFLFVGPTGTGKTEITKALAEYLFGSPDRMLRLDMSEYQTPDSLERLLAVGRPGQPTTTFLAQVRKEPFSVVLLDEFEKAHPRVWDVFLQVFDDGRLTDESGRTADLRQCVIILTSNVGSSIPAGPGLGFSTERAPFDPATVQRAVGQSFRPEFLNRLDRVVVFRPLERETMRELLRLELSAVLERRGLRVRPWAVEWDDAAIELLLEKGFSAELGARPLKRAVERLVLAPLAMAIVERRFPEGDQFLFIGARDGNIHVEFVDPDEPAPAPAEPAQGMTVAGLVLDAQGEPGEVALLEAATGALRERLGAQGWRARKESALERTREDGFWERPDRFELLGEAEYLDRIDAAMRTAEGLLRRLLGAPSARAARLAAERVHLLRAALEGLDAGTAADAVIAVKGDAAFAGQIVAMYEAWASKRGMRMEPTGERVWSVTGLGAFTLLSPEAGLHVLETPDGRGFARVNVSVAVGPRSAGESPRAPAAPRTIVRRYRREPSPLARDAVRGWRTGRLDRVLDGDFDVIGG